MTAIPLGDVCALRTESVDSKDHLTLPFVGLEHIDSGSPKLRRYGNPSAVRSAKFLFYPSDVLYGKLRPYLDKAVLAEVHGICSTDILVLPPNGALSSMIPRLPCSHRAIFSTRHQFNQWRKSSPNIVVFASRVPLSIAISSNTT